MEKPKKEARKTTISCQKPGWISHNGQAFPIPQNLILVILSQAIYGGDENCILTFPSLPGNTQQTILRLDHFNALTSVFPARVANQTSDYALVDI
jgi:microcystin-dependent protein